MEEVTAAANAAIASKGCFSLCIPAGSVVSAFEDSFPAAVDCCEGVGGGCSDTLVPVSDVLHVTIDLGRANEGLSEGAGGLGSLIKGNLGTFSVFGKVRSGLLPG